MVRNTGEGGPSVFVDSSNPPPTIRIKSTEYLGVLFSRGGGGGEEGPLNTMVVNGSPFEDVLLGLEKKKWQENVGII